MKCMEMAFGGGLKQLHENTMIPNRKEIPSVIL
jgi:hypothetical protein